MCVGDMREVAGCHISYGVPEWLDDRYAVCGQGQASMMRDDEIKCPEAGDSWPISSLNPTSSPEFGLLASPEGSSADGRLCRWGEAAYLALCQDVAPWGLLSRDGR